MSALKPFLESIKPVAGGTQGITQFFGDNYLMIVIFIVAAFFIGAFLVWLFSGDDEE